MNKPNTKLKSKILILWAKGKSKRAIAEKLNINRSLVQYYIKKYA